MILRTRLPLFSRAYDEKIGEPGDEAKLELSRSYTLYSMHTAPLLCRSRNSSHFMTLLIASDSNKGFTRWHILITRNYYT